MLSEHQRALLKTLASKKSLALLVLYDIGHYDTGDGITNVLVKAYHITSYTEKYIRVVIPYDYENAQLMGAHIPNELYKPIWLTDIMFVAPAPFVLHVEV